MKPIFLTPRLYVRNLELTDLSTFHEMQGNLKVMQYTTGRAQTFEENKAELKRVIDCYTRSENDFWVWAVLEKGSGKFVGTCALIKNGKGENEIGYRFLESSWGNGYGKEITVGLIDYGLDQPDIEELVAYVDKENVASVKILDATFKLVKEYWNEEEGCVDRYYRIAR
jgi:ribosomal-protein-alanine N-acetyltransferase